MTTTQITGHSATITRREVGLRVTCTARCSCGWVGLARHTEYDADEDRATHRAWVRTAWARSHECR